jgi:hypothetical protein
VVTAEKYLSVELFSLLAQHRDGIEYVFVLNKIDRTQEPELIAADLAHELDKHGISSQGKDPRILAVSALAVRRAQHEATEAGLSTLEGLSLGEEAGSWPALRDLLERELDKVRIREIKAAKLADRVKGLLGRVEGHVPGEVPDKIERWRSAWLAGRRDLTSDLSRNFFGAIQHDPEIHNLLRYLFGTGFRGLFGGFLALTYGIRSLILPGFSRARSLGTKDLEALLEERLRRVEIAGVERRIEGVLDRFEQEGRALGFHPPERGTAAELGASGRFLRPVQASTRGVAALVLAVRGDASREFYAICTASAEGASPLQRILWNVLPGLVLVTGVYAFVGSLVPTGVDPKAVAASLTSAVPLLEGTLLSLLLACAVEWPIAERVINGRVDRALALLEGVVERAVEGCLGQAVVDEPERVLAEILERHREFERLREDADRLLRDEASPPSGPGHSDAPAAPREEDEAPPAPERLRA